MAVGDVVSDVTASVAAAANSDFQPAAGVEVLMFAFGSSDLSGTAPDGIPDMDVKLFDGTNEAIIMNENTATLWGRVKVFLTNTNYLRMTNTSASGANLSYSGIQTAV